MHPAYGFVTRLSSRRLDRRRPAIASAYKQAGVDIERGNALVEAIKPAANATERPGVMGTIGGFGGLFDLAAAGYDEPILVAATDGVGTKLKLALEAGTNRATGIDLVAMSVNDLVVQGAEPLFFLDYFGTGALDLDIAREVVEGVAEGCRLAGCALIGGETAEMPGLYGGKDFDVAGFCVGAVERNAILPRDDIVEGDVVFGLASSGPHSNGFSLVNKILSDKGLSIRDEIVLEGERDLADALLEPTRIYVASCLAAARSGSVKAFAHITGGGLAENLTRVLPDRLMARIDATSWTVAPVFSWLAREGGVAPQEMARVFNCGLGLVAIVGADGADQVREILVGEGEDVFSIGLVEERRHGTAPVVVEEIQFDLEPG